MTGDQALRHFFGMGLQYYAAGRFSALAWFIPVAGNLLHHAVEMMLKGHLSRNLSLADLKRLSHRLPDVWAQFKKEVAAADLDEFDPVVEALDRFEAICYPDRIVAEGMFGTISISAPPLPPLEVQGSLPTPAYHLVLEDVDRLVKTIFEKSSVNPKFFSGMLRDDGKTFVEKDNKWMLDI